MFRSGNCIGGNPASAWIGPTLKFGLLLTECYSPYREMGYTTGQDAGTP
ncbi:hypothetical protein HMPREF1989_02438 [Porphyromonas gingivalis F0566]|nr:hypothetical protein HMPREF1989_02438 [Porphyromonas gingivalis F0566]